MLYFVFHRIAGYFAANGLIEAENEAIYLYGYSRTPLIAEYGNYPVGSFFAVFDRDVTGNLSAHFDSPVALDRLPLSIDCIFSAILPIRLAPAEDRNKPLNQTKRKVYHKSTANPHCRADYLMRFATVSPDDSRDMRTNQKHATSLLMSKQFLLISAGSTLSVDIFLYF